MLKKNILFLFLIFCLIFGIGFFSQKRIQKLIQEKVPPTEEFPSPRAQKYYISGGGEDFIFFKELIVDPFEPTLGEKQTFSIWTRDEKGVESVIGEILTEKEKIKIDFKLVEGTNKEGRWQGFWITKNIIPGKTYQIIFVVKNKEGKEVKLPFSWPLR